MARRLSTGAVFSQAVAGGHAAFTEPCSPLNKVAGLGSDGPVPEDALRSVEEAFAQRRARARRARVPRRSLATQLTGRGYVLEGFENVLGLRLPARDLPVVPEGIEVRRLEDDELVGWLDVTVSAFLVADAQGVPSSESFEPDVLRRIVSGFAKARGMTRYLARFEGTPAGGASLRVDTGIAQLCGAATLPACRRRGIQTALLSVRLADTARAGCDLSVVTTQPGSRSQENVQKGGFTLLYSRAVLTRAP